MEFINSNSKGNTRGNKIVSIEGNIGSGKSTLLKNLQQFYKDNTNIVFIREPVDQWSQITNENDVTILECFYNNQKKYAFTFQMMAYVSRLKLLKEAFEQNMNTIIITERSLFTDRYIFAQMLFDTNNIELIEFKIYLQWFDTFANDYPVYKYIYVNTQPDICFERINERSRDGENTIELEYLIDCDKYHKNMLDNINSSIKQLHINGNINIKENISYLDVWCRQINDYLDI